MGGNKRRFYWMPTHTVWVLGLGTTINLKNQEQSCMALLRYSTRRFGLSPTWLVVVVLSPLCSSRRCRCHVGSCYSFLWCWATLFLLMVGSSSILPLHRSSLSSSWSLLIACRGWSRFAVVGFDLLRLVLIRPRWFRVAPVGFLVVLSLRLLDVSPFHLLDVSHLHLLALPALPLLVSSPPCRLDPPPSHPWSSSSSRPLLIALCPLLWSLPPSSSSSFPLLFVVTSPLIGVDSGCRFVLVTG